MILFRSKKILVIFVQVAFLWLYSCNVSLWWFKTILLRYLHQNSKILFTFVKWTKDFSRKEIKWSFKCLKYICLNFYQELLWAFSLKINFVLRLLLNTLLSYIKPNRWRSLANSLSFLDWNKSNEIFNIPHKFHDLTPSFWLKLCVSLSGERNFI